MPPSCALAALWHLCCEPFNAFQWAAIRLGFAFRFYRPQDASEMLHPCQVYGQIDLVL